MTISDIGLGIEFLGFFFIFFNTKGLLLTIMMWIKKKRKKQDAMWMDKKSSGHGHWYSFMQNFYVTNYNNSFSIEHWTNKWKTYYGFIGFSLIMLGLILQLSWFNNF